MLYASNFQDTFLTAAATLEDALETLNSTALRVCLVVEDGDHLIGILTDGDVRRALLNGKSRSTNVREIMNPDFYWMRDGTPAEDVRRALRARTIIQVPILDPDDRVTGLASRFLTQKMPTKPVTVVLMAGGLGSRLGELSRYKPKPLLEVAGKPILEHVISQLRDQGFDRFIISLNHMADQIEGYFGDGSDLDVSISYVRETMRLGTAGALSLLEPEDLRDVLLVMNGDVICDMPFNDFVTFHLENEAHASMCVNEQSARVDFGVVEFDDENHTFLSLREKPEVRHFINAGIYCLSRDIISLVPRDEKFDMPMLFEAIQAKDMTARVYPCDGFWIDIGRPDDYERVQNLFRETALQRRRVAPSNQVDVESASDPRRRAAEAATDVKV